MVEIIGFIISLLALFYLFIKQSIPVERQAQPRNYQDEGLIEDDPFKEFLKAVEKETAAREAAQRLPPPPPAPKIKKEQRKTVASPLSEYRLTSQVESRQLKSALEERRIKSKFHHPEALPGRPLDVATRHFRIEEESVRGPSRAQLAIQRLANRQDMLIYREIFDKPKSLRPDP